MIEIKHLEACVRKFQEDLGVFPNKIRITYEGFCDLRSQATAMNPFVDMAVVDKAVEGKFMGIPLEVIEE